MKAVEIKPDVYWVGGIDWDLRNFHGYLTQRGSSYNSYLIVDEKVVLVDTVKHYLFDEMLSRIADVVDPSKIDCIVINHVEMDHSGSLEKVLKLAPNAVIYTSAKGKEGLEYHYDLGDTPIHVVKSGDRLNIGKRNLTFAPIPMVHWPDSMMTYIAEDRILMPNDGFGQHIAADMRFDDEMDWGLLREEAGKYYANIVLPFGVQVKNALKTAGSLEIDTICPSHGIIWRSHVKDIIGEYVKWADHQTEHRAVIIYDTMWKSTEKLAYSLWEGLQDEGIPTKIRNLSLCHVSDVIADVLNSRGVFLGCPTLNNGLLSTMGAMLTYMEGLKPQRRIGYAFGSYGWSGQAVGKLQDFIGLMKWESPEEPMNVRYIPTGEDLRKIRETGKRLGRAVREGVTAPAGR